MIWNESMYYGPFTPKKVKRLQKKIQQKKIHPNVFLVVINHAEQGSLEVIPSVMTLQPSYPVDDLEVVGMAVSKPEALVLIQHLIGDTYTARADLNVKAFLAGQGGQQS